MRLLLVGDIVGNPGRRAVGEMLEALRSRYDLQFVIVNGENSAGGFGITKTVAKALFDAGADVITLGNHAWAKRDSWDYIANEPRILRPANYPHGVIGRGWGVFDAADGSRVAVVNLLGRIFMNALDCPFRASDSILAELSEQPHAVVIDFHAEATSEKIALGYYLDGRTSAVIGTHTHIQTSDERVLPGGTAYLTDVGMTGVVESVLGLDPQEAIKRFLTQMPGKIKPAEGDTTLQGVIIDIDCDTRRARGIQRISVRCVDEF
ncbi:MAG: TIGR00282 family metallophosphoesterase [Armatimonadota bacterium]|nr:TIGR00282 family metallophosphoesterase [bacterium]